MPYPPPWLPDDESGGLYPDPAVDPLYGLEGQEPEGLFLDSPIEILAAQAAEAQTQGSSPRVFPPQEWMEFEPDDVSGITGELPQYGSDNTDALLGQFPDQLPTEEDLASISPQPGAYPRMSPQEAHEIEVQFGGEVPSSQFSPEEEQAFAEQEKDRDIAQSIGALGGLTLVERAANKEILENKRQQLQLDLEQTALDEYKDRQLREARALEKAQLEGKRQSDEALKAAIALSEEKTDPGRWWGSRSTGQKLALFVAAMLQGYLKPGEANTVVQNAINAMNNDMDLQVADRNAALGALTQRRGIINDLMDRGLNESQARGAANIAWLKSLQEGARIEAAKYDPAGSIAANAYAVVDSTEAAIAKAHAEIQEKAEKAALEQSKFEEQQRSSLADEATARWNASTSAKAQQSADQKWRAELVAAEERKAEEKKEKADTVLRQHGIGIAYFVPSGGEYKGQKIPYVAGGMEMQKTKTTAAVAGRQAFQQFAINAIALRESLGQEWWKVTEDRRVKVQESLMTTALKSAFGQEQITEGEVRLNVAAYGGKLAGFRDPSSALRYASKQVDALVIAQLAAAYDQTEKRKYGEGKFIFDDLPVDTTEDRPPKSNMVFKKKGVQVDEDATREAAVARVAKVRRKSPEEITQQLEDPGLGGTATPEETRYAAETKKLYDRVYNRVFREDFDKAVLADKRAAEPRTTAELREKIEALKTKLDDLVADRENWDDNDRGLYASKRKSLTLLRKKLKKATK